MNVTQNCDGKFLISQIHFANCSCCILLHIKNFLFLLHSLYSSITQHTHNTLTGKDLEVLQICASCLTQSSIDHAHCKVLLDRNIFGSLQLLIDLNDDIMKHNAACIIANLSGAPDREELLVSHGVLAMVQTLNSPVHRADTMCFILLR